MKRSGNNMILSDKKIKELVKKGELVITPFDEEKVQPNSYDVTLGRKFMTYNDEVLDAKKPFSTKTHDVDVVVLCPKPLYPYMQKELSQIASRLSPEGLKKVLIVNGGVLAHTAEKVSIPQGMACQLDGKSTIGRMFCNVHVTAGWCDTGFGNKEPCNITLEIIPLDKPVILYAGMPIGQLIFQESYPCDKLYDGKYGKEIEESKSYLDFK